LLAAGALRSSRLEILGAGSGNAPTSSEIRAEALRQLMSHVASGRLRIETQPVPLGEVEEAWRQNQSGRRTVLIP
jgi:hypothetical protein